jgi:ATP-dependent helicase/nuclease subunit B
MDRPDTSVDVRIRGTAIHSALETFVETYPADLPADAADVLDHLYIEALRAAGMDAIGLAREQALAREIAAWMVDQERQRRSDGRRIVVEQAGQLTFATPAGTFVLTAKADRLEIGPGQIGRILDYKTGAPPSNDTVKTGFSPQLTLTGAILEAGGFPGLKGLKVEELSYVRITGRRPAGEIRSAIDKSMTATVASAAALDGLKARIEAFDNPNRPYTSRVAPSSVKLHPSDYDHLARVREWSSIGEGEDT